jgi:hypothetical protein
VNLTFKTPIWPSVHQPSFRHRWRLYGFCLVIALAFVMMWQCIDAFDAAIHVQLPAAAATLFVVCLAGAEVTIFLRHLADERQSQIAKREEAEQYAIERQQTFNRLWQSLADTRGSAEMPAAILTELAGLFSADLVAVWSADPTSGGYQLRGAHPAGLDGAVRLDRVAHLSPCFDKLRDAQDILAVSDFEQHTSKAMAWYCEENDLQHAVLCPVLVRRDLVGVLALFFRAKPELTPRLIEEMQAAGHLFLCAL